MSFEVFYSPRAQHHLNSIYDYIAEQAGANVARRFTKRIEETCSKLRNFPQRGIPRDDIRPGLRMTTYRRRVVIIYAVHDQRVVIPWRVLRWSGLRVPAPGGARTRRLTTGLIP